MSLHDLTVDEVEHRGLDHVVKDVASGHVVTVHSQGGHRIVLVDEQQYATAVHALETSQDVWDAVLSLSREMTSKTEPTPLDAVITRLGFTREELEALDD